MRPLRYSINVTLDGCCDHRAIDPDEDVHRYAAENIAQADALLYGRVTYEMMEAAWREPARSSGSNTRKPRIKFVKTNTTISQCRVTSKGW